VGAHSKPRESFVITVEVENLASGPNATVTQVTALARDNAPECCSQLISGTPGCEAEAGSGSSGKHPAGSPRRCRLQKLQQVAKSAGKLGAGLFSGKRTRHGLLKDSRRRNYCCCRLGPGIVGGTITDCFDGVYGISACWIGPSLRGPTSADYSSRSRFEHLGGYCASLLRINARGTLC